MNVNIIVFAPNYFTKELILAALCFFRPPFPTLTTLTTRVSPGGVLGFWGGVGSMGAVFLLVVLTQRYCCRRRQDKEEAGQVLTKPH